VTTDAWLIKPSTTSAYDFATLIWPPSDVSGLLCIELEIQTGEANGLEQQSGPNQSSEISYNIKLPLGDILGDHLVQYGNACYALQHNDTSLSGTTPTGINTDDADTPDHTSGNLEFSTQSTIGVQKQNLPEYLGQLFKLECGVTGWWSSALCLEGASQGHDSTVFTGFRLENRFKPVKPEHRINPILYFEYENISEATRIKKEIVGHAHLM
jgi:hypothetical protein